MKKNNRRSWVLLAICIFLFVFLSLAVQAQTTGSIKGTVKDVSSQPIQGIVVDVYHADDPDLWTGWISSATTNASGNYEVTNLPACTDCYKINYYTFGTNYISKWHDNQPDFTNATKLSVTAGQAIQLNDTFLLVGGSISGKVSNTSNEPIQGVYVYVYKSTLDDNGDLVLTWVTTATTDGSGNYRATGLPIEFSYAIYLGAFNTEYISKWYNATVYLASTTEKVINIQLEQGGKISGTITSYNTVGDQVPVAMAFVDVYKSAPDSEGNPVWIGYARTDAAGLYTATGLPAGNFKVQFFEKYSNGIKSGRTEWHDNKYSFSEATSVSVTGNNTTEYIDAILGHNKKSASALIPAYKLLLLKPRL